MKSEWNDRMTVIAQNGNEGLHYELPKCTQEVWDSMVAKAAAGLNSDYPLLDEEVLVYVDKFLKGDVVRLEPHVEELFKEMAEDAKLRYNSDYPRQDPEDKVILEVQEKLNEII